MTPDLLTAKEVQAILRVGRNSVYELARRREIGHVRVGTKILFPRDAVEEYLKRNAVPAKKNFFGARGSSHTPDSMRS